MSFVSQLIKIDFNLKWFVFKYVLKICLTIINFLTLWLYNFFLSSSLAARKVHLKGE